MNDRRAERRVVRNSLRMFRRNLRRSRDTDWRRADRYIERYLARDLAGLDAGAEPIFGHVGRSSFAVALVLRQLMQDNRAFRKRIGGDFGPGAVNNGMCGLFAWVCALSWNRLRAPGDACAAVVFPGLPQDIRSHVFVKYNGILYDGAVSPAYLLRLEAAGPVGDKGTHLLAYDGNNRFVGHCVELHPEKLRELRHVNAGLWWPWSSRRADRMADAVAESYGVTG